MSGITGKLKFNLKNNNNFSSSDKKQKESSESEGSEGEVLAVEQVQKPKKTKARKSIGKKYSPKKTLTVARVVDQAEESEEEPEAAIATRLRVHPSVFTS